MSTLEQRRDQMFPKLRPEEIDRTATAAIERLFFVQKARLCYPVPWTREKPAMPPKPLYDPVQHSNRLLDAFEPASRARIDPHIQLVNLVLGDVVCEAGGFLEHVYFPRGAVQRRGNRDSEHWERRRIWPLRGDV
jgi:hypothetical protein